MRQNVMDEGGILTLINRNQKAERGNSIITHRRRSSKSPSKSVIPSCFSTK